MTRPLECDLLVVGGGLAGSSLAIAMAREGKRVVLLERELVFRDRIRGELVHPWGVAEVERLGLLELLLSRCARELPFIAEGTGSLDTRLLGPHFLFSLGFLHGAMQEALLNEASNLATVWRGAALGEIEPGAVPRATVLVGEKLREVRPRLIVGADGRDSVVARTAGFERARDPEELITMGVLVKCDGLPDDQIHVHNDPRGGRMVILLSPDPGYQRLYLVYHKDVLPRRLSGAKDFAEAIRHMREIGVPEEHLAGACQHGPLGSFDGAHRWTAGPARAGVVLVGDAAAASDPAWGCGLSRTLRDVRLLRDALCQDDDWKRAAGEYARSHDHAFAELRAAERLCAELFMAIGSEADEARARLESAIDDSVDADINRQGPEMPRAALESCHSNAARQRLAMTYQLA